MKLNKLASIGAFMIILAQVCALTFAIIELANYPLNLTDFTFAWFEMSKHWLLAIMCILIPLSLINIITTLLSMFKVNSELKALSVWLAIISMAVIWYPYFFPAIFAFTGAILILAGKYKPISELKY